MFEVATGGKEDREALEKRDRAEALALLSGQMMKTIFLNGGSDTRKYTRNYYENLYRNNPFLEAVGNGWSVTIRKRRPKVVFKCEGRESIETNRTRLPPEPEYVILMVGKQYPSHNGQYKFWLQQFKEKRVGKTYFDGEFISDWVQYI